MGAFGRRPRSDELGYEFRVPKISVICNQPRPELKSNREFPGRNRKRGWIARPEEK